MSEKTKGIAEQIVDCGVFRLKRGMMWRWTDAPEENWHITGVSDGGLAGWIVNGANGDGFGFRLDELRGSNARLVINDPATKGCLLDLVRRTSGHRKLALMYDEDGWSWYDGTGGCSSGDPSEAKAFLHALKMLSVYPGWPHAKKESA